MSIESKNEILSGVSKNMVKIIPAFFVFLFLFASNQSSFSKNSSSYRFPDFDWQDHPAQFAITGKPVSYEIQIACDKKFSSIVDQDTIALSRYVHDQAFNAGTYYWRVRSITFDGKISDWSKAIRFTIKEPQEIITVVPPDSKEDYTDAIKSYVKKAEKFAFSGRTVKLVLQAGDYYFSDKLKGALFQLKNVSNIEIEGNGATLHFSNRKQGLIEAVACENIAISGFNIKYAKGACRVQGHILAVEPDTRRVTVSIEKDSPEFSASSSINQDIFILMDPNIEGRMKDLSSSFYRMDSYEKNYDGTYEIKLSVGGDITDWEVGGRFVYHFRGGSTMYVNFPESKNVTAYNLTTDGWGGMGFVSIKGSNFNILHCKTVMQEGNWMMGNADGVHIREHEVGPWLEGTHIQGLGDDGLALYARPTAIVASKPYGKLKAAICDSIFFNFEAGDEVSFFEPTKGKILLETIVVSVDKQSDGRYLVHFADNLPGEMITQETLDRAGATQAGANGKDAQAIKLKLQDRTQIWNRSKSCGEFVIRNSKFTNIRRYGSVFRSKRGLIENNIYRGCSSNAIKFHNETQWPNGLYPSEIIIRNNMIEDSGFDSNGTHAVISFVFERRGGGLVESIGARNLLIEGNTIVDCPTPGIVLQSTSNVVVRNNKQPNASGGFETVKFNAVRSENVLSGEKLE